MWLILKERQTITRRCLIQNKLNNLKIWNKILKWLLLNLMDIKWSFKMLQQNKMYNVSAKVQVHLLQEMKSVILKKNFMNTLKKKNQKLCNMNLALSEMTLKIASPKKI